MARPVADKLFGYRPPAADPIWLEALSIFATDRRGAGRNEVGRRQMRRKRSLKMGQELIHPDMVALGCLRALRDHMWEVYHVRYDGYHNKFKEEYDDVRTSSLLGFMETIAAVFNYRSMEMDMVLKMHEAKTVKAAHAIRDLGTFDPESYEDGRESAYRVMVLALPVPKKFNLLEGMELLDTSVPA